MGAAVELREPLLSCFCVKSVHILREQPVQLPSVLPAPQLPVATVRPVGGKLRPPDKVPGPVPLAGLRTADELRVLHGSPVGAGVEPDPLRAVVGDARLGGETRASDDEQPPGPRHKVLQQLQRRRVRRAAGGDEAQLPRRD